MLLVLNMSGFSGYTTVLNMPGLHRVLNMHDSA